jgi:hypothetical protein
VQFAGDDDQLPQRRHLRQPTLVALAAAAAELVDGRQQQLVDAAEVVEDQGLVEAAPAAMERARAPRMPSSWSAASAACTIRPG